MPGWSFVWTLLFTYEIERHPATSKGFTAARRVMLCGGSLVASLRSMPRALAIATVPPSGGLPLIPPERALVGVAERVCLMVSVVCTITTCRTRRRHRPDSRRCGAGDASVPSFAHPAWRTHHVLLLFRAVTLPVSLHGSVAAFIEPAIGDQASAIDAQRIKHDG